MESWYSTKKGNWIFNEWRVKRLTEWLMAEWAFAKWNFYSVKKKKKMITPEKNISQLEKKMKST